MNNNDKNNLDMATLMQLLSKMDKDQLEAGIKKANEIIRSNDKNSIMGQLNKKFGNK